MEQDALEAEDAALLRAACARAAEALLQARDWQLLNAEQLAAQAAGYLAAGVATDPHRAALHAYCHALHAACAGTTGVARQERGYTELFGYLLGAARSRYLPIADDVVQQALERIHRRIEECRQPGAFLAFALQILRDAAASSRAVARADIDYSINERQGGRIDWRAHDPLAALLDGERQTRIAAAADALARRYPRAKRQLDALLLKYLDDLDDQAIAVRLETTVENVYVLRARAVVRIQGDQQWRALATEFGFGARSQVQ